ncbi:MAG: adenylate/guanylate cyclase domain-containing protein [Chloroflexota bacterium]|nr:adenylate/guanylate cyclase domain-containing protein [Chloroflexota bacterium]
MSDPKRKLPTGTVTFLFSDIQGSTRLAQELDPATYRGLLEQHHRLLRAAFRAHGGAERGTQGDAFLVIFRDARSAIAAAVDAQRALAAAPWPNDVEVRVRMGLHSGEGIRGGDDYVGPDINRAARIAAAGHGGQILISDATRALAERDLPQGVTIRDLGQRRLKDLVDPEHLFQLIADDLGSAFPEVQGWDARPNNLPTRLTSFVGRVTELEELRQLLADNRLVTLTGPGGTGKTSLATELARRSLDDFPDGAWFIGLEAIEDPGLIESTIVTALGLREGGTRLPGQTLRDHLRDRTTLLVLDNFERLLAATELVGALLREAAGLRIVVTSRAPLHVAAEQEYPLLPLPLPPPQPSNPEASDIAEVGSADSVQLFVDRARRAQPAFTLSADVVGSVAEICRRLDGLPLGIELAAARVGLLSPASIAERLARRLPLPGNVARELPTRQRTIALAIDWSYELLDPPTQRLFARLSVFAGSWDVDAAEAVAGPADEMGIDVLEGIAHLVDQSLVRALTRGSTTRFTMLETIRDFAGERLGEADDASAIRGRHALHYLALAETAAAHLPGREQVAWLGQLTGDLDNVRAGVQWALGVGDAQASLRFGSALWRYWQLGGRIAEGLAAIEPLLAVPDAEPSSQARMRALEGAGGLYYWGGNPGRAAQLYQQQLAIARELANKAGEANALLNLSATTSQGGDLAAAFAMADEAGRLYEELGDVRGQARVDSMRGIGTMVAGDAAAAREMMARAATKLGELDDVYFEAATLTTLSWANFIVGDIQDGIPYWRQSIELNHALGDIASTTLGLEFGAIVAWEVGLLEEAAVIRGAFEALSQTYGVRSPRPLEELVSRIDYLSRLIDGIGREQYETLSQRGRKMSLDEVVGYSLGVAGQIEARLA